MDNLDERLKALTLDAQQHFGTPKGRQLLMQLWTEIQQSGKLWHPPRDKIRGNYKDIYDDAIHSLFEYILRNIREYDPNRPSKHNPNKTVSVIGWVNMLLERRFIRDAMEREKKYNDQIAPLSSQLREIEDTSQFTVENLPAPDKQMSEIDALILCLEEDRDKVFEATCMKKYPQINFKEVALRHIEGEYFSDISRDLDIPYISLVSFFQRSLKKLTPKIRACPQIQEHLE